MIAQLKLVCFATVRLIR